MQGTKGVVEEIGLTYTWIRTRDNDRLVVPNEKLASDTIRNSTIRSEPTLAEVTVEVPAGPDLRGVVESLKGEGEEVFVSDLTGDKATILVRKWVPGEAVGRARRERPAHRARRAARAASRVSPPPLTTTSTSSSRHRGRKKKRADRIRRRRRAGVIVGDARDRRHRRACSRVGLGAGAALSAELRPEHAAPGRDRPELVRLRARRLAARLDPGRAEPRAGVEPRRCRSGCRARPSRSRTGASTSTAASTTSASRAPRGRT